MSKKKIIKRVVFGMLAVPVALVLFMFIAVWTLSSRADMLEPDNRADTARLAIVCHENYLECGGSMLRQSESGLWEAYVGGAPHIRGAELGKLTDSLLYFQEKVFVDQIRRFVPSDGYLKFLRRLLMAFNRNLGANIPAEYREEIYGVSQFCTHGFDAIGTPYERQLNYHAAHDIGHTMQEYMLVGCSSFGAWGSCSADSSLIVGRNFDFWVGDDFALNKIVLFVAPDAGYKFASVSWPGMMGVLSGINEKGLTVTINAAKGPLPTSSATPISILTREILQYASNIGEAVEIARSRRTFVSESILVGSAQDGYAVSIEKSPEKMAVYESGGDFIICTNHFRSALFAEDPVNLENIRTSDSPYRCERMYELISENAPLDAADAVSILRDRYGLGGRDIGLTNEKSLNQSIAHHAVVFQPEQLRMWVSTGPWQSGRFVCYDLRRIFAAPDFSREIYDAALSVAADSVFMAGDYHRVLEHRRMTEEINKAAKSRTPLAPDYLESYIANNPEFCHTYLTAASYYAAAGEKEKARYCLETALTKEIPRPGERNGIEKQLKKLNR